MDGATWSDRDLLEDKVNGASRVDVHEVNVCAVVDELCTPCHGIREAALHLQTHLWPSELGPSSKMLRAKNKELCQRSRL